MELERLQQSLFLKDEETPLKLYRKTAEFFDKLAEEAKSPLAVALVARDSRIILSFLCHPKPRPEILEPFPELVEMATVFAMQRYELGSTRSERHEHDHLWLFDVATHPKVIETGGFVRFQRDDSTLSVTSGKDGKDVPLRRYSGRYSCEIAVEASSEDKTPPPPTEGTCSLFMPHFGPKPDVPSQERAREPGAATSGNAPANSAPKIEYFKDCRIRAIRYAAHQTGAEVFLFISLPSSPTVSEEAVAQVCSFAITGTFPLVDELRRQVSTANPRYVSRYFQITLGQKILDRVFSGTRTLIDGEFLRLFLERERGHEVVVRRLLRYAFKRYQGAVGAQVGQLPKGRTYKRVRQYWDELTRGDPPQWAPVRSAERKKTKVIVVASPRGGVGKSTIAYFLAGQLALRGKKTCYVELDIADPTVYHVDEELRKHIQRRAAEKGGDHNPMATLWNKWRKERRDGLEKAIEKAAFKKEVGAPEDKGHVFSVFAAMPFEVSGSAAKLLAAATASDNHTEFLSDLTKVLRGSEKYEYIVVDTAAGFRDFTEAMVSLKETDSVLIVTNPTKLSILSTLESFDDNPKIAAQRMLVMNGARDIDRELFVGVEEVIDFCIHWARNGADEDAIDDMQRMVHAFRSNCAGYCLVPWNEAWVRMEVNVDTADVPMNGLLTSFVDTVQ